MCGESDLKTLIALFIMDRLGIGGSFAEFHPADFNEGFILVGHDVRIILLLLLVNLR